MLERAADALGPLAAALDPDGSPLAHVANLSFDMTGHLLRAQRALSGAGDAGAVIGRAEELIAMIPAPSAPFAPAVDAINGVDVSALAGPMHALRDAVQTALDGVAAARAGVRDALAAALTPLAEALDALIEATRLEEVVPTLAGFAGELETEINTTVRPAVNTVRGAVETAVDAVAGATETFDPAALVEPLRDALDRTRRAPRRSGPAVRLRPGQRCARCGDGGDRRVDLSAAADEAIGNIEVIETKLAEIDPADIPDALKPAIAQAVHGRDGGRFRVSVSAPLVNSLGVALELGPGTLLSTLESGIERLRAELDAFRPSAIIGAAIDEPFRELAETLHTFTPSALLSRLQHELDGLAARANVLDPGALLDPLVDAHRSLTEAVAAVSPAVLLRPVNEQADRAVQRLMSETRLDSAFAGIAEFAAAVEAPLELLADVRDLLRDAAGLLADPGDATAAVNDMLDETVARLDTIDMATLASGFAVTAGAIAVDPARRDRRSACAGAARRRCSGGGRAGQSGRTAHPAAGERAAASARTARATRPRRGGHGGRRSGSKATGKVLTAAAAAVARAQPTRRRCRPISWTSAWPTTSGCSWSRAAERSTASLGRRRRIAPPCRRASAPPYRRSCVPVLRALHAAFRALAPWAATLAQGLAELLDAARFKLDVVLGDAGLGGAAKGLAQLGERLTHLDLAEVQAPLQALHTQLETAVGRLDPAPIQAAIRDAAAAVTGLLNVETLVPAATLRTADQAWAAAVAQIDALSPEEVIAKTLDPAWEHALGALAPALELPLHLRTILDAASGSLTDDAKLQLARVEDAFDRMLRAIPLRTGMQSASMSGWRLGGG